MVSYGALFRICRKRARMTQEELAEKMNRSRTCITKYENGHKMMDLQTFLEWVKITKAQDAAAALVSGMDIPTIIYQIMQVSGVA